MTMNAPFWSKYRLSVLKQCVPKKTVEWYLRWIIAFEKALPGVPLNERSKENVQAYMDSLVTTMIYTHVLNKPGLAVKSPADL